MIDHCSRVERVYGPIVHRRTLRRLKVLTALQGALLCLGGALAFVALWMVGALLCA